jgi:ubiquitin C-terminal hydrolase
MSFLSWIKRGMSLSKSSNDQDSGIIKETPEGFIIDNTENDQRSQILELLKIKDENIVLVEGKWFEKLETFLQGGSIPTKMMSQKLLTKTQKLKKGLKLGLDYYFLYQKVWDIAKSIEDETITLDVNKKLKKMKYKEIAHEYAQRLLGEMDTYRINPTDIHLPNAIVRNECIDQEKIIIDEEDLKKDSSSTNYTSIVYTDSNSSSLSCNLRLESGRVGLENPGLFCYLNSGIQCLLSITHLVEYTLRQFQSGNLEGKELSSLMAKLMKMVFSMKSGVIKPRLLWKYIIKFFPSNKQHDMPEFVRFVVNQVESELGDQNAIKKYIFNGVLQSNVLCNKCFNSSRTNEPFIDLQIELSESIDKSIQLFTQDEVLSTGYYCFNCRTNTQALKTLSIFHPPNYLVLQIKRFRQVPYPHKLTSFSKYRRKMTIVTTNFDKRIYELIAVGVHIGSINSGHYIAYAKRSRSWNCFDDSLCSKATIKSVLSQYAYMLIYKLIE